MCEGPCGTGSVGEHARGWSRVGGAPKRTLLHNIRTGQSTRIGTRSTPSIHPRPKDKGQDQQSKTAKIIRGGTQDGPKGRRRRVTHIFAVLLVGGLDQDGLALARTRRPRRRDRGRRVVPGTHTAWRGLAYASDAAASLAGRQHRRLRPAAWAPTHSAVRCGVARPPTRYRYSPRSMCCAVLGACRGHPGQRHGARKHVTSWRAAPRPRGPPLAVPPAPAPRPPAKVCQRCPGGGSCAR